MGNIISTVSQNLPTALLAVGLSAFCYLLTRFYSARQSVWKLQKAGLPMPKFHFLAGHLLALKDAIGALPPNTVMHQVFWRISKQFPDGIFYINLWPFARTILVVTTPAGASQVQDLQLSTPPDIVAPIEVITGGPALLTMLIGPEWKRWRKAFSPGFSEGYMIGLAPAIAHEVAVFRRMLLDKCVGTESDVFQLEELTLRMTFDIIGSVTLDAKLQYQIRDNELARSMRTQIEWTNWGTDFNPIARYLNVRPIVHWINDRRMDRYIAEEIDKRIAEKTAKETESSHGGQKRSKSVVSLLMDELLQQAETAGKDIDRVKRRMREAMTPQIRAFLFAGHDTTSSTLLFAYYLLSQNPEALDRVLAEHDEVFGPDASRAKDKIAEDPQRLNRIPYTMAVIRETLRLFPPAGSMRIGRPGAEIVDEAGRRFPTEGCNVWTLTLAIHHNPVYWMDVETFLPERWLVGPDDLLHPPKGAWRPFERGPKSCIGQPLALLELRITLVMTLREFAINPAYDKWDALHPKARGVVKTIDGNRCYQAEKGGGGAHPADGFPVTISLRAR